MAIPSKNGVASIIKALRIILRMAALYSDKWGQFLSPADKALLDDLVACGNAVMGALDRSEYRP